LLARKVPYPYESVGQVIRAQASNEYPALSSVRGDVPKALDDVVARGLVADPAQRFATVDEWMHALEAASGSGSAVPPPPPPVPAAGATMSPDELRAARAGGAQPPTPPPPAPPSGGGGASAPPPGRKRRKPKVFLTLLVLIALLAGAIGVIALTKDDKADGPKATEVFAEPISSLGTDPFAPDSTPPPDVATAKDGRLAGLFAKLGDLPSLTLPALNLTRPTEPTTTPTTGAPAVPAISGNTPGLYGGTNLLSVCDVKQLVTFLQTHADKAKAWAETLGIKVDDIANYASTLTDVILRADTRVTNHSFKDGKATAINSILQAGTAILVDKFGVPVVRCKCGNPLTPAKPLAVDVTVHGQTWPNFSVDATVTITKGPEVTEFTLGNVVDATPLYRTPGTPAVGATPTPGGGTSETTAAPTTAPETTVAPPTSGGGGTGADVTSTGTGTASSEYPGGEYPASLAIDGNPGTSWFSAGSNVDGDTSVYTWTSPSPIPITKVEILSNSHNSDPSVRSGYGFDSVLVEVLNAEGRNIFSGVQFLNGTPDPDISVDIGADVVGQTVRLSFSGHEAPDCGGFAELHVYS
jgi:hypothetical protein